MFLKKRFPKNGDQTGEMGGFIFFYLIITNNVTLYYYRSLSFNLYNTNYDFILYLISFWFICIFSWIMKCILLVLTYSQLMCTSLLSKLNKLFHLSVTFSKMLISSKAFDFFILIFY